MSLLESLKRGWWSGWAEFPELVAGGAGLLESLIPGDSPDDPLERLKDWGNEAAQGLRLEGGGGTSTGLLEKIAEGIGAAPGTLASMAPFMYGGGAVMGGKAAATLGGRIAAPALGFGAHSLIRHGDEGLPTAIGHGLKGAAEGALFGGIGAKTAGMLVPKAAESLVSKIKYLESLGTPGAKRLAGRLGKQLGETGIESAGRQLGRKGLHGLGVGGAVGGMTLAHGGDLEDAVAGGTTMGLLGLLSSGKYRGKGSTREEALGAAEAEIRKKMSRRELAQLEPLKEAEFPSDKRPSFTDVAQAAKPYDAEVRTQASIEQFMALTPENQKIVLERQVTDLPYPLEAYQRVAVSPEQTFELTARLGEIQKQKALVEQHKARATETKDPDLMENALRHEDDLVMAEAAEFEYASGSQTQAGRALVNVRWAKRNQPEWVEAVKSFEKQFGAENSSRFRKLAKLSEGDPALMQLLTNVVNRPKAWDYMMEYWINGLLSGPTTQMVNVSSNALRQGIDHVEKRVGLHAEIARSPRDIIAGKKGTKLKHEDVGMIMGADRSAAWAAIKMLPRFLRASLSEAKRLELIEKDPMMQKYAERTKLDHPTAAIPGKAGSLIRIPGNMLQVMDLYFKGIAGQRAAAYTSYRKAYEMFRDGKIKETEIEGKIAEFMGEGERVIETAGKEIDINEVVAGLRKAVDDIGAGNREAAVKDATEWLERIDGVRAGKKEWNANDALAEARAAFKNIANDRSGSDRTTADVDALLEGKGPDYYRPLGENARGPHGLESDPFNVGASYQAVKAFTLAHLRDGGSNKFGTAASRKTIANEPAQFVLDAMKKEAEIQTFTQKITHPAGRLVAGLREVPVRIPILGFEAKPGTLVVPFWQTPWNVVIQSIARSPLGLLRMSGLKRKYESGDITPQEYYKEVTGTVMGTAVWASLLTVAKMGGLTGGGPTNYADRQNLLATGWRPYSIKVGDAYWQMQRLEPFGTVLGLAADAAEFGSSDDKTSKAIAIVKDNLSDKSFLYGLESFAKAFANPEQKGSTYYRQMAGSIVPTFFSKAAQAVDPYQRIQEPTGATAGVPDALAYRIPGVSRALPPRTTALGEKAERWGVASTDSVAGSALSAAQSMVMPMPLSLGREGTEVERELNRLRGYDNMPPSSPRRTRKMVLKGVTGENVKLTDDEYAIYDRYHQMAKKHMGQMISSVRWASIPDPLKAKMLDKVYKKYRSAANKEITVSIRRRTSVGE